MGVGSDQGMVGPLALADDAVGVGQLFAKAWAKPSFQRLRSGSDR
jgi:hypothetical protein